jgi:bacillithiol system protein YtxJ
MNRFIETSHLTEIIERSRIEPVAILKYSNNCGSSSRLEKEIKKMDDEARTLPIYLVVVQKHVVLSRKISEMFDVKHESPQMLIVKNGKVIYTAHHGNINLDNLTERNQSGTISNQGLCNH